MPPTGGGCSLTGALGGGPLARGRGAPGAKVTLEGPFLHARYVPSKRKALSLLAAGTGAPTDPSRRSYDPSPPPPCLCHGAFGCPAAGLHAPPRWGLGFRCVGWGMWTSKKWQPVASLGGTQVVLRKCGDADPGVICVAVPRQLFDG